VAGDWNGDGTTTVGAFDPATATWYLRNSNSPGGPSVTPFVYGAPGWIPVVGDWDGDGTTTIGVVDPSTMTWYLRNSNSAGVPDVRPFAYGGAGWRPVVGDWDGDGRMTVGVVDPRGTWYLRNSNSAGAPDIAPFPYGLGGWAPVAGAWTLPTSALRAARDAASPDSTAPVLTPSGLGAVGPATLIRPDNAGMDFAWRQNLASARTDIGPLGSGVLGLPFVRARRGVLSSDAAG
jgi:hypothetical protein